jgi:hypothetical protein
MKLWWLLRLSVASSGFRDIPTAKRLKGHPLAIVSRGYSLLSDNQSRE